MIWLNSPSNPTGQGAPHPAPGQDRGVGQARDVVVASDECYIDLGWETQPVSILSPEVCGGDHTGLLAVHSLSKRSNMAGYRAGFVSGDPALIRRLLALRKHLGFMLPTPVQAAAAAALGDDGHVLAQRSRYLARRETLSEAFSAAGFSVRAIRGRTVPVVHPRRTAAKSRSVARRARSAGRARHVLRSGGSAARQGGPDRDGRTGGCGGRPADKLTSRGPVLRVVARSCWW